MGQTTILIDIGSTFTKAVAVDVAAAAVVATARAPTTAGSDVRIGLRQALAALEPRVGRIEQADTLASSSAAGGLRMISIGLVPELSAEAARRAALGAGAKIVGHFSHELSHAETASIAALRPDIVLLAGGTDGGNSRTILHNARRLATATVRAPVVVAGNKSAQDEALAILASAGWDCHVVDNVMPRIGVLQVEACRAAIREIFIANIVHAKGLDGARSLVSEIVMPTPVAVLEAARLLAEGDGGTPGMGELLVVDVGGATTDVYSVARGLPSDPSVTLHGLPEPWAKRTVEGDLGVRHNVETLLDLCARFGVDADRSHAAKLVAMPHRLPGDDAEARFDGQLAAVAVRESVDRHVGRIETLHGPQGESRLQVGKDLSSLGTVIGTGGPIIHGRDPRSILRGACADRSGLPKPVDPALYLDADYLMFALGLLARREPRVASTLLRAHLRPI
ncbi:MAG: glutamate mutase L [Burkholderiaceae bacterium]|jgi:uncharacterized protein (TIGR01319 family)|nr:glutamate mutase L [Burkholderiaceae bacterium]